MKMIIKREETFENNSDMELKVTQKQLSLAFVKETQWSKTVLDKMNEELKVLLAFMMAAW